MRKKADLTQVELAAKLGVKQNVVSNWENGKIKPKYKLIPKIAKTLNVDVSELLKCFE